MSTQSKAAKAAAAKKAAATAKAAPTAPKATGKSQDEGGVGNTEVGTTMGGKRIPESAIIRRPDQAEKDGGTKISKTPEIKGDKDLTIIDLVNGSTNLFVSLVQGVALNGKDGRLVFIQGPVGNDWATVERAKTLFAMRRKDGVVFYNSRGFDDAASAGGEFDMVDIAVLIEHHNKGKK